MTALTQRDLDGRKCATPGCDCSAKDGLVLSPLCHPGGALFVQYDFTGVLTAICAQCEKTVATVAVAEGNSGEHQ